MKGRAKKSTGGVNDAAEDLKSKPMRYTADSKVNNEAEERKRGGKTVKMSGDKAKMHAGRKPRKNGGRTGSDGSPFTSARHGTPPPGHKVDSEMD